MPKTPYCLSFPIALAVMALGLTANVARAQFNLDTGNAPIEVIIPTVAPIILTDVSTTGGDATLVIRITTIVTNAWFDAAAPFHPTAVGIYSRLGRKDPGGTNRNINVACLYASYRVLNSLLPNHNARWRAMLVGVGLNPNDASEDLATPSGIGNRAGKAVALFREQDGMNQLGDHGGQKYNRRPYSDYTGYEPLNTAYNLIDPSRWQPRITSTGNGIFRVQQFVTPQFALTRPYSIADPNTYRTPEPVDSNPKGSKGRAAYKAQVDHVLQVSANLTEYQKLIAELFNNKILSLGFSAVFAAQSRGLSLHNFIQLDFLTNLAAFDVGIVTWSEKRRWDAVRPFSAIRHQYGDTLVRAWGGSGKGTVNDLRASDWSEYIPVADHPEYPSGSAAFCGAHAQSARRFLGDDMLQWSVLIPAGGSVIEPGFTPQSAITLGPWLTWTEFETECGLSRLWGGVHFMPSIEAGWDLGHQIGDTAYEFLKRHIDGTAAPALSR